MKPESQIQNELKLEYIDLNGRAYRNNSGVLNNEDGVPVRYGLGNESKRINNVRKSSDLVGFLPVVITQAMVGHTVAVLTVTEAKKEGWRYTAIEDERAQKAFIDIIVKYGGIGCFAQSVLDFKMAVKEFYKRFQ